MSLSSEKIGNTLLLSPEGRIDSGNAESFKNDVSRYIEEGSESIVLDFINVEYISSACLRSLLRLSKLIKEHQRKMVICNLQDSVNKIIKVSGFDSILDIYEDRESALNKLST